MTERKKTEKKERLGKGFASLFSSPVGNVETVVESVESKPTRINLMVLRQAHDEVRKSPVVGVWSVKAKTLLRYLVLTVPAFKESTQAGKLLETALRDKYPDLWTAIEESIQ